MHAILTALGILLLFLTLCIIYRVIKGPTAIDRIVAVNMIGTKTSIFLVIIGTLYGRVDMFVDISLTYAMLSFIGSIAIAHFYHKKHIRASEEMPHGEA